VKLEGVSTMSTVSTISAASGASGTSAVSAVSAVSGAEPSLPLVNASVQAGPLPLDLIQKLAQQAEQAGKKYLDLSRTDNGVTDPCFCEDVFDARETDVNDMNLVVDAIDQNVAVSHRQLQSAPQTVDSFGTVDELVHSIASGPSIDMHGSMIEQFSPFQQLLSPDPQFMAGPSAQAQMWAHGMRQPVYPSAGSTPLQMSAYPPYSPGPESFQYLGDSSQYGSVAGPGEQMSYLSYAWASPQFSDQLSVSGTSGMAGSSSFVSTPQMTPIGPQATGPLGQPSYSASPALLPLDPSLAFLQSPIQQVLGPAADSSPIMMLQQVRGWSGSHAIPPQPINLPLDQMGQPPPEWNPSLQEGTSHDGEGPEAEPMA